MRKSLWIVLVLVVLGGAPLAHADSFEFTVTDLVDHSTATFVEPSLAAGFGSVTSFLFTTGSPAVLFSWDAAVGGDCSGLTVPGQACGLIRYSSSGLLAEFAPGSFLSPGTYQGFSLSNSLAMTVTITEVSGVPEPSSLMLLGSGLLAVAGIKRRRSGC